MYNFFSKSLSFYDNITFTQSQISTTLAEMSDLSLLWKLRKTLMQPVSWQGFNKSAFNHMLLVTGKRLATTISGIFALY